MSHNVTSQEEKQKKLIVCLDPGIDDAQAVLMALADPNVKILALCLNHGNTTIENVTNNILRFLKALERKDIPVFRGCGHALVTQPDHGDNYFGKDGFGDCETLPDPDKDLLQSEHAVSAMLRLVKENPGQITLVNLSPLTNVAMAHRLDPDFSVNLKDCFIMGGNHEGRGNITRSAEFNFYFDAEAADVVLSEFQCPISLFTWELCLTSKFLWDFYDSLRKMDDPKAQLMKSIESKLIKKWKSRPFYVICDELAMAAALNQICMEKSEQVSVRVECHGQLTRGQTVIDWNDKTGKLKNVRVVTKMNRDLVKLLLRRTYGCKEPIVSELKPGKTE